MMDKQGAATIDDVQREQLLRRLPQDVLRHLESKGVEGKTGKEVAAMADIYYDKSGKLKHSSSASINSVRPQLPSAMKPSSAAASASPTRWSTSPETANFTSAFDEPTEVNAVRFKQGQKQRVHISNGGSNNFQRGRSQSRGRSHNQESENRYSTGGGRFRSSSRGNTNSSSNSSNGDKKNKVCYYHITFGDSAKNCNESCMLWAQYSAKGRATN